MENFVPTYQTYLQSFFSIPNLYKLLFEPTTILDKLIITQEMRQFFSQQLKNLLQQWHHPHNTNNKQHELRKYFFVLDKISKQFQQLISTQRQNLVTWLMDNAQQQSTHQITFNNAEKELLINFTVNNLDSAKKELAKHKLPLRKNCSPLEIIMQLIILQATNRLLITATNISNYQFPKIALRTFISQNNTELQDWLNTQINQFLQLKTNSEQAPNLAQEQNNNQTDSLILAN